MQFSNLSYLLMEGRNKKHILLVKTFVRQKQDQHF